MQGRVVDVDGEPVAGAHIEVWQADEDGFYDVQYADLDHAQGRGHLSAGEDGRFWFWSVKPEAYAIPDDGPVGELLKAAGRGPMRPAHVHFKVDAPGFQTLITHVFVAGDEYLGSDAAFAVKEELVVDPVRDDDPAHAAAFGVQAPFADFVFDVKLIKREDT
jgi:protocatechuate 3,4-dioxygenase beta subunit